MDWTLEMRQPGWARIQAKGPKSEAKAIVRKFQQMALERMVNCDSWPSLSIGLRQRC
jgi:hypothetical protein